jgi:hypothetical protein
MGTAFYAWIGSFVLMATAAFMKKKNLSASLSDSQAGL